jgi:hypothetical protein
MIGDIAVAFSIVRLLPVELLIHIDTGADMGPPPAEVRSQRV